MKQLRKLQNLKQKQVAEKLGVSESYINKIENYKEIPTIENMIKLSYIYNTTIDNILIKYGFNPPKRHVVITNAKTREIIASITDENAILKNGYDVVFELI